MTNSGPNSVTAMQDETLPAATPQPSETHITAPRDRAPRALVFGASGYIGSNLVPRLRSEGLSVRAAARNRKVLEAREWQGVELAESDALNPTSLPGALAGMRSPPIG
ncbi:MAG: NAD(P)H-binding protein, partial [Methylotetracoccus sp.]|nr:NAD(P)H-binding protein [Methylotetracoccus sp.]